MHLLNSNSHICVSAYTNVKASELLAHFPFFGTYFDVSTYERGCALAIGNNVQLAWDQKRGYVQIRKPGFLNIPLVDLRAIPFSIEFSLRFQTPPLSRQWLLTNWQDQNWQYWIFVDPDGTMSCGLRANTKPTDPAKDLVIVQAKVPFGKFFDAVFVYDTTRRTFSIFINGVLGGTASVDPSFSDLTLHTSSQQFIQFGNKGDDSPVTGVLDADLSQLRFYKLTF